ncbi:hypothetical protein BP6252_03998 [Coleophoma cylindrospora]|uniref:FAD-binding PCMH-type domain-containing protein n=1 Tax=Coleophoma cylindrospora TaxID=1849047 RepID=A0A3D8RZS1_9HELO|nr:hypothetical protein BP6252_03998 [Coleophoma cylindrospora]
MLKVLTLITLASTSVVVTGLVPAATSACKCIPSDTCWPTATKWDILNKTVSGRLLQTTPVAAPCYAGPNYDAAECAAVVANWTESPFQADYPIGYIYPQTQSCDIPGGNTTTCSLGTSPVYAINATTTSDIIAGIEFARLNNIRLVVKTTGHDILARSTGFGSLEIWLRYFRHGVTFQQAYQPTDGSCECIWDGPVISVQGGYSWQDVYPIAIDNNVIVVGGGCPDVSVLGGYTQGGGHSLANHEFGLAADQLLEAQVILASGEIVTASGCENTDLFTAIRGGGGGTYGIVISGIIKAHPESTITAQVFAMAPLSSDDAGLSGYGSWMAYAPYQIVEPYHSGLNWAFAAFGQTPAQVEASFAPTLKRLSTYNGTSLYISTSYLTFGSYYAYYYALNGVNSAAQSKAALVSRLMGRDDLSSVANVSQMLNITAGTPDQFTLTEICLIGGGAVLEDSRFSGVNPAWRKAYIINLVALGWQDTADYTTIEAAQYDITYVKGAAMTALSPDMGAYMNEGNYKDPDYLFNFYGAAHPKHEAAKAKYDPKSLFYCPTCVGSDKPVSVVAVPSAPEQYNTSGLELPLSKAE